MLIKKLSAIAAVAGFCTFSTPAVANETANLKAMLEKQQAQIEALSQKLEKQETVHNEALTHYIKNEVDRALADSSGSLLTLGSNVENLTIKGDLRVRLEPRARDPSDDERNRWRQRVRLGMVWKTNEGWEIGAGLATGGTGYDSATSTNDTYSEKGAFETGDINLDYAYAKHKFDGGVSLTLGQHKNPYVNSDIMFDSDARPVGATVAYAADGFFATTGLYEVWNYSKDTEDSAKMGALQVGMEAGGFTAALGYFHYNSSASVDLGDLEDGYDDSDELGETDFNIVHAYAEYAGKTDSFKYALFAEYFVNMGADKSGTSQGGGDSIDPEDEDSAIVLGAEVGISDFKVSYRYHDTEADSAPAYLVDGDFGGLGTKGHTFKLGYKVTKNFSIGTFYRMAERQSDDREEDLFQLDFKYKF